MACLTPIRIRAKRNMGDYIAVAGYQMVPCGACLQCKRKKVTDWAIRLYEEEKRHHGALFVTLTYAPHSVPITENKRLMSVSKPDLQKYFKRLRKLQPDNPIKYYAAAEYGTQTKRPHYHIILYGTIEANAVSAWILDGIPLGDVHIGTVTEMSIAYSLKYISKDRIIPQFPGDDRVPEFSLMSKNSVGATSPRKKLSTIKTTRQVTTPYLAATKLLSLATTEIESLISNNEIHSTSRHIYLVNNQFKNNCRNSMAIGQNTIA